MPTMTVIYDACVLYPAPLRDLLLGLAQTQLFQARWTDEIHEEWTANLLEKRPELQRERLARTRELMNAAVPDCLVTGYADLIPTLILPDPQDRHVLATAIHCHAAVIVTFNQRDFPAEVLAPYGLVTETPDQFLLRWIEQSPTQVYLALKERREALRNPPKTPAAYLDTLAKQGLLQSVQRLREAADLI